ncbi:MAG TPA: aryl-sulfate sulfotransferase [Acidimicrobiales bacterium]|nr:aryl-sulfate sulfotransferase [Acidimicrobiales bacterium]|tara:strand:- start:1103 stop:2890 length:1788 start_codon:yes stop_codon:yes gene_type:complete
MYFKSFWVIVFLVCLTSCSSGSLTLDSQKDEQNISSATTETAATSTIEKPNNPSTTLSEAPSLSITIEATPYSPIAASLDIKSSLPVAVKVTATSESHQVTTARTSTFSSSHIFPLIGLRQSQAYEIKVLALDESGAAATFDGGTFISGEIDYPLPKFDLYVDLEQSQSGITLIEYNPWVLPEEFGLAHAQPTVGIDHEGEVVFWYRNTGVNGAVQVTPRGTFIAQYWPLGAREFDLLGNVTNNWQVSPEPSTETVEFREADALHILENKEALAETTTGNPGDPEAIIVKADWVDLTSFHHEVFPMPNGNLLAISTTNHPITEEQMNSLCPEDETEFQITSDVIVEFEVNGNVLRTWDLWDVLEVEEIPGSHICNTTGRFESIDFRDWTHANAVIYDEVRDAVIVSSRHTDQIIAFDHLDVMGPQTSVRWILGKQGTLPLEGELFYHQHAVELQSDGSILLYDNGNFRPGTGSGDSTMPHFSRAVLYRISDDDVDSSEWEAAQLWDHRVDDSDGDPLYAEFLGDADRMENGNVLITHGGIWPRPETQRARIIEVVPAGAAGGDIVWDLALGDADVPVTVYRAERLPSLYFGPNWE